MFEETHHLLEHVPNKMDIIRIIKNNIHRLKKKKINKKN